MNTTPQLDSNLNLDTDPIRPIVVSRPAVSDLDYIERKRFNGTSKKVVVQLANFRALSRQVFGPKTGYEYLAEAILFGWMMVVAAWPLSVTLNQLGTMYISPPNALW